MLFATIIAHNYRSRAYALARSLERFHAEATLAILVVDGAKGEGAKGSGMLNAIEFNPEDLRIDDTIRDRMRLFYDVTEFCTALKPQFLLYLLETNPTVCYLDPDMVLLDKIADVHALAAEHGVLVTPHCLTRMPMDGFEPNEQVLLRSGIFNLGFLAVSAKLRPFLTWWATHLEAHCVNDKETGLFVDQKWFDFLPALVASYAVSRDRTLNVAYWNLYERWHADPERRSPRLFHFSGFHPMLPEGVLTGHFPRPRPWGPNAEGVARLVNDYVRELLDAGFEEDATKPYGHDRFENGRFITSHMRRFYRNAFLRGIHGAPNDPWVQSGSVFCEWYDQARSGPNHDPKHSA